jgi:hypothetical protein
MSEKEPVTYEQFAAARTSAIRVTDQYLSAAADSPRRPELWQAVVRETESARGLLEAWLRQDAAQPLARTLADRTETQPGQPAARP